jgi:hypothetical protein
LGTFDGFANIRFNDIDWRNGSADMAKWKKATNQVKPFAARKCMRIIASLPAERGERVFSMDDSSFLSNPGLRVAQTGMSVPQVIGFTSPCKSPPK